MTAPINKPNTVPYPMEKIITGNKPVGEAIQGEAATPDFIVAEEQQLLQVANVGCRFVDDFVDFVMIENCEWGRVFAVLNLETGQTFLTADNGGAVLLEHHTHLATLIAKLPFKSVALRQLQKSNAPTDDCPGYVEIGEALVLISLPADVDRFIQEIVDRCRFINEVLGQVIAAASTVDREPSVASDETRGSGPIREIEYGHGLFVDGRLLFRQHRFEHIRQTAMSLH